MDAIISIIEEDTISSIINKVLLSATILARFDTQSFAFWFQLLCADALAFGMETLVIQLAEMMGKSGLKDEDINKSFLQK